MCVMFLDCANKIEPRVRCCEFGVKLSERIVIEFMGSYFNTLGTRITKQPVLLTVVPCVL
jgi:hypothetical protein